jgi:ThiF family
MQWVLRDPSRFLQERKDLEELHKEGDWLVACAWRVDADLVVEVDMDFHIHGKPYAVTLTYPDLFPETPAYIRPRDPSQQLSNHQYGPGGSLCLEWRADNWERHVTGADLARSAHRLLTAEKHPEQPVRVPSAHYLTEGQKLRSSEHRLVCTFGLLEVLATIPNNSCRSLRKTSVLHIPATVAFISKLEAASGEMVKIDDLPSGVSSYFPLFVWPEDGKALRSSSFDNAQPPSSFDELSKLLEQSGFPAETVLIRDADTKSIKSQFLLLFGDDPKAMWAIAISAGEQTTIQKYDLILPQGQTRRLPVESEQLAAVRFGIVGVGSIGSKVAVSLARSGARRFLLVDDDYLAPHNICRHELSWAAVGTDKVHAVREALMLIAPDLDVRVLSHRVAGQESALMAAAALKDLSTCDVLIDATANPDVFLRLAAIAKSEKKPMCWAEVFAGGIGGMIARARPDIDPNPVAVRAAFLAHLETLPLAPFQQATGYDVQSQEPLTAYDSDVTQIASALTRLIIDTALRERPSIFPYSLYMIGLRKAWFFTQPFDTRPIPVQGAGWESNTETATAEADRKEAVQVLLGIIVKGAHADAGSST